MTTDGLRVTGAFLYPIKGTTGIPVSALTLDEVGPVGDRRWMLVDPAGEFLSQRSTPEMARIAATFVESVTASGSPIEVTHPDMADPVRLPGTPAEGERLPVRIWDDELEAVAPSAEADRWFSQAIGRSCRVVSLPDSTVRTVRHPATPDARVAFADGFPLLAVTQESLDGLNGRLREPVPMDRFRPNLVIGGASAEHEEDRWRRIRIGGAVFRGVRPCARCIVPTIDQATGVRPAGLAGSEPIRTLSRYRRRDGKVFFGQNLVHEGPGTLRVGDPVEVLLAADPVYRAR